MALPQHTLQAAVAWLDDRIKRDDGELNADTFARLMEAQRAEGLVYGTRPICSFLRPYIMARSRYTEVSRAAETLAGAFERLAAHALRDGAMMDGLGLTARERRMARIDPGYKTLCVTSRFDTYLTEEGFQFLEYNAESPAGVVDQLLFEKIFFSLPHIHEFLERYPNWRARPHVRLLAALDEAYREWSSAKQTAQAGERPQIGIIDWEGVSTVNEFRVLKDYFETQGYPTIIADPREIIYDGHMVSARGFRIDILYKRVIIHEFLEKYDETHPMARAYADGNLCMVNSFRSKIAHKKAGFAVLSDPQYASLFTAEQLDVIRRHIPWTRRVRRGRATFHNEEVEIIDLVRRERERFVLKPNDEYGGRGVHIGWETSAGEWEEIIENALRGEPYIVQERAPVRKVTMPVFSTEQLTWEEMTVDFDPFLFFNEVHGGLARMSATSLSNVSSGGGETALVILEDF